jgi:hypothetical protein
MRDHRKKHQPDWDSRHEGSFGRRDNYRNLGDRRSDVGVGAWEHERIERPGYNSLDGRAQDHEGPHRGKGPVNYTRSDERIREEIHARLTDDPFTDATDIVVKVNSSEVTLAGIVNDKRAKRRAEDISEAVAGVRHVENRLRLRNKIEVHTEDDAARTISPARTHESEFGK